MNQIELQIKQNTRKMSRMLVQPSYNVNEFNRLKKETERLQKLIAPLPEPEEGWAAYLAK